jgi:hypothetical protein
LQEIVDALTTTPVPSGQALGSEEPPLRFYVFEGYRVSYAIDPVTRRVVVTTIRTEIA